MTEHDQTTQRLSPGFVHDLEIKKRGFIWGFAATLLPIAIFAPFGGWSWWMLLPSAVPAFGAGLWWNTRRRMLNGSIPAHPTIGEFMARHERE